MADGVETQQHAIETILLEERRYPPPEDFASQANAQPDIYDRDFDEFWETEGRERVTWFEPFGKLLEWEPPYAKWYLGGKLNICFNCVDRHVEAGNGAKVPLKQNADEALDQSPTVKQSVVLRRAGEGPEMKEDRDVWWHDVVEGESDDPSSCPCEPMDSEDLLYLLYTSGTTAKPKGIVHTTGGYLVGTSTSHYYIFDVKPDSVYWCAADIGWVTGHSYIVYGPLCNGTTGIIYEGVPNYPNPERWWEIVERYKVDILYTAPTAIRSHMKWGPEHAEKHDLSSLRLLGTVGEPINPEAWIWYREHIGGDRTPVVDTWWQTETGMILITPLPGVTTLKPGSP